MALSKWIILIGVLTLTIAHKEHESGFYVDNGSDQTVPHYVPSEKQKQDMTHDFLNFLNLPIKKAQEIAKISLQENKSASRYIYDVYQETLDGVKGTFFN